MQMTRHSCVMIVYMSLYMNKYQVLPCDIFCTYIFPLGMHYYNLNLLSHYIFLVSLLQEEPVTIRTALFNKTFISTPPYVITIHEIWLNEGITQFYDAIIIIILSSLY